MNKGISFCLWGNSLLYCEAAAANAELAQKYFPTWEVVFYADKSVPYYFLKELQNLHCRVVICNDDFIHYQKLFRRFLYPYDEYDIFIIRDTDSRICERDAWAVNRWLLSDKTYHNIRDGFCSFSFFSKRILGSTFGIKAQQDTFNYKSRLLDYIKDHKNNEEYGCDETFLNDYLYEQIKNDIFIHATKYNNFNDTTELIPESLRCSSGYYVGQKIITDGILNIPKYNKTKLLRTKNNFLS